MYGTHEKPSCNVRAAEPGFLNMEGKEALGNVCVVSSSECKVVVCTYNIDGAIDVGIHQTRKDHREIKYSNYKWVRGSKEQTWRGRKI